MVKVEVLAPAVCGAKTIFSLHFFLGKRFWGQVVAPEGNPNSCGLVGVTVNEMGLANVIGGPFLAELLSVNVNVLALPTGTLPKFSCVGLDFRCPGTGVGVDVGVIVGVGVLVAVAVAVGVAVEVAPVAVAVGVGGTVPVAVAVGVGVPAPGTFKDTVSIAKSVQSPVQLVMLKTTLVMLAAVLSRTPMKVASPLTSLVTGNDPSEVPPLNAWIFAVN